MLKIITNNVPRDFVKGYIDAALWSSYDEKGEPLDSLDLELSDEFKQNAKIDCQDFINSNLTDLGLYAEQYNSNPEYAGHDFWLTRNGHGAGFWDRGLKALGERLSDAAKVYGGVDLYVCDGVVYAN